MTRLIYKPIGFVIGVLGWVIAGAIFKRVWRTVADEDESPRPTDRERSWAEVVLGGVLKGAVFGGVKALVDRAGATGFERVTGTWPGKTGSTASSGAERGGTRTTD